MAEKWRRSEEASEDSMTPAGPTTLDKASRAATDVTTSVLVGAMEEAEEDVLKDSVRGMLLRWATMTCQTLKLEMKAVVLYSKLQAGLVDACVIIMLQSFVIGLLTRALTVVVSSSTCFALGASSVTQHSVG